MEVTSKPPGALNQLVRARAHRLTAALTAGG
jgi:hypothetical protein